MPTPDASAASTSGQSAGEFVVGSSVSKNGTEQNSSEFVDRRREGIAGQNSERRQFGSSHSGLSEAGRELAFAIDQYKLQHHRRYITCDEMLLVITRLGYSKD